MFRLIFYLILGYFLFVLFRLVSGFFRIVNVRKEQQQQEKNWRTQDPSSNNRREKDISAKGKILEEKWLDGEDSSKKKKEKN